MTLILYRKQKGLNSEEISKKLGISRAHYTHLENGTRAFTEDLIKKTANVLELPEEIVRGLAEELRSNNLVPNSWIFRMKINGKPFLQAFLEDTKQNNPSRHITPEQIVNYIFFHIEHSIRKELSENPQIISFISKKIK